MNKNRLDMLEKLSMFDKHDNSSVFKSYMNAHYAEIYSFYDLLEIMDIGYSELEYKEPIIESDRLSFLFTCDKSTRKQIEDFFDSNIVVTKSLKKHHFEVLMSMDGDTIILQFNTPIKEG